MWQPGIPYPYHPGRFPPLKRLAFIAVPLVGLAVALAFGAAGGGSEDGPLDGDKGNGHGSPVIVGSEYDSFSVGLDNRGDEPIEIKRVRLVEVSGPVELIGVRARLVPEDGPPGGGGRVGAPGQSTISFPLKERNVIPVPTSLSELGNPEELLQILFRVKMTAEGIGRSRAVRVDYRAGGKSYTETFPFTMTLCAPRELYIQGRNEGCGSNQPAPDGDRVLG